MGKAKTAAIVAAALVSAAGLPLQAAPRVGSQNANQQEILPTPPDPVAVQKWFGQAVGDILTAPEKVLKEGTTEKK